MACTNSIIRKYPLFNQGPFVRFTMNPIDHPKYGMATFSGDIPLLLPFRGRTCEEILPDLADCEQVEQNLIHVGRVVWPDEDDEGILTRIREYTFSCAIMGGMKPSDPRFPLFVYAMLLFINVDDQLDSLDSLEDMVGSYKQVSEMLKGGDGNDPLFDRPIPNATAGMARMMTSWDELKAKLLEIPDYRAKYQVALRQEILLFVSSHVIKSELKQSGLEFSDSTLRDLLRNIASPAIVTEYVAILRDANIPDHVRQDVLFSIARNKVSDVEIGINALIGLQRDLKLGQTDSSILYAVTSGRLTLQEAIEEAHKDLVQAMHDLKVSTDKLLEIYAGDETVRRYVHIMVGGMDGYLYAVKFVERYRVGDKMQLFEK